MNHELVQIRFRVPDLEASSEHLQATLGVAPVGGDGASIELALPGQAASVVLTADETAALDSVAFVTEAANLAEIERRAAAAGVDVTDGRAPGERRLIAPNHLAVDVSAGAPDPRNTTPRPAGPVIGALDHVSLMAADLDATVAFFVDVLGFRLSDSVGTVRHWLRCGPRHHTVAIFEGGDHLQHYAFETADLNELGSLGDLLALRGQNFLWGPGRHALGANIFSYHVDPAGAILEVTTGMIEVPDEDAWVTQVWSPDTPASAVMWGPMPTPGFRETSIPIYDHERPRALA